MKKNTKKNVIVLMFDSLQYNYLGCNGNDWIKTPNFDRFAREGVTFDNCYIEGLPTVPCRRAMHTGRYSLPFYGWSALTMEETTIADLCWGRPIDTALIFDCPMYRMPKFGYTRSFDKVWFLHGHEGDQYYYKEDELIHYKVEDFLEDHVMESVDEIVGANVLDPLKEEIAAYLKNRQYWRSDEDQNVAKVMKEAVRYMENIDRNKSFFMWVDNFDPHEPWDSPSVYDPDTPCPYDPDYKGKDMFHPAIGPAEIFTEEELHHIRMLYGENVTMVDKWLGYFMDNVKRLGLEDDTLILLLSDHGEPMGNGEHGHGIMRKCRPWPYEELVHGVMMMQGPGIPRGKRTDAFVQSCDVAPTVCEWLGIGKFEEHQGEDLLPLAKGEVEKVRDFAIAGYYKYSWSIITHDWSYIHWLQKEEQPLNSVIHGMYRAEVEKTGSAKYLGGKTISGLTVSEEAKKHAEVATLDDEDQWTCTPSAKVEVPERDELYDRRIDLFQLNNVIDKHPEKAEELLKTLKLYMGELRSS